MKKDIVLFGAGGFGREVMWLLEEINRNIDIWNIMGFIDDTEALQGKTINGYPVLGNIDWLTNYKKEIHVLCCIGASKPRKMVIDKIFQNPHVVFPTIIADNVKRSDTVRFGKGSIICASNVITVNITVGNFVIINLDCTIGHDAVIEDFVTLYPSVNVSGYVHIGNTTEIGTGANIVGGIQIGERSIVGAGAVVVKDIPSDCTAVGAPAKPIKFHAKSIE